MQLSSHGPRGIPRVSKLLPSGRSIHIPAYLRVKPRAPSNISSSQRILSQTRTFITRFIGHLTTPGLQLSHASTLPHSVRAAAPGRMSTIQQRLSYPVRHALARPVQPLFFPHAPTFASRSVAQVGLGTARNFHSGRSVFQNLVQNVPITGRALYEADWDIQIKRDRAVMKKVIQEGNKSSKGEMLKPKNQTPSFTHAAPTESAVLTTQEMDKYFTPIVPDITTYLLIPLAPTPTSRVPLDPNGSSGRHPLLPLSLLASTHNNHELHTLKVSSLFSRLDAANVWERGVVCSSYASHVDKEGVCTILKVEFTGWSIAEVRSIIGEAGTGWCVLEEEHVQRSVYDEDDESSDTSSILSGISGPLSTPESASLSPNAVSDSFVLPTLDFSSSFLDNPHISPILSRTSSSSDLFSELAMEVDDPWSDVEVSDSESSIELLSNSRLRFSHDFARRSDADLEAQYSPREDLF
ncbi:hypothetical protein E1B28_002413 [Marasmius oreades]|uniref:Uncharacterized protein n=1 Tax=Marasmius oreades TaxID=181124 RepID=A0A9P7UN26_9AGAR|nr:uncharacterized protein E1B28_002413 [Marasmius oreades]KAG7086461.1 hypothetical protein E1B28_002413 [Marasmius oreades]